MAARPEAAKARSMLDNYHGVIGFALISASFSWMAGP